LHRLRLLVITLRGSLWFVPSVMIAAAIALGVIVSEADLAFGAWAGERWPRFFGATPEGARAVLGTIAAAMATVTGIVFSMTLVALSLAATHYGSRVLRQFMRDRLNQVVLGLFLGVFAYCLVVARTIRSGDDPFVPALAVTLAIVATFVALGFLIYFLHHVATSVQAPQILATLAHETLHALERDDDAHADDAARVDAIPTAWTLVPARAPGFVRTLAEDALAGLAEERDRVVRVLAPPGTFVSDGTPLAAVAGGPPDEALGDAVRNCFGIGVERTIEDDAGYGIRQIVDIALRALSPGVNDPTTAVLGMHWLAVVLRCAAARPARSGLRCDARGRLRLLAPPPAFGGLLRTAYEQIATAAKGDPVVLGQLASALERVADGCATDAARKDARTFAAWLHGVAGRDVAEPGARRDLQKRLRAIATGERPDADRRDDAIDAA
jgi:uncharacterized membrane protein